MFNKKKKGFTIVELVIVIGVIGVLAGILIPTFVGVKQQADQAALKSNLANAYSTYIADAADGIVDDRAAIRESATTTKFYILALGQEEVTLKAGEDLYRFTSANGWAKFTDSFETDKNDIVLTSLSPKTFCSPAKTATYGGFEIWSTAATHA